MSYFDDNEEYLTGLKKPENDDINIDIDFLCGLEEATFEKLLKAIKEEELKEKNEEKINKNINKASEELKKEEKPKIEVQKVDADRVKNTDEVIYIATYSIIETQKEVNLKLKEGFYPLGSISYCDGQYIQTMVFSGLAKDFYQSIVPKG